MFCKHKPIIINKNKSIPKIISEIQKTYKIIYKSDFDNYFRITNCIEVSYFEDRDEKKLYS